MVDLTIKFNEFAMNMKLHNAYVLPKKIPTQQNKQVAKENTCEQ